MQALGKQVAETDTPSEPPTCGTEARLAHGLGHRDRPSNYQAMRDGVEASGQLVKRCWKCRGTGAMQLTRKDLEEREQKIRQFNIAIDRARGDDAEQKAQEFERQKRNLLWRLNRDSDCKKCGGIGWLETFRRNVNPDMFVTHRCSKCRGSGEVMNEDLEDVCQACNEDDPWHGDGYYVPFTAKPTCGSGDGDSHSGSATDSPFDAMPAVVVRHSDPEPATLVEFGRVMRVVAEVRRENEVLAAGIERYYGPEGAKWAGHSWGRTFSLWDITKAGAEMARSRIASHSPLDSIVGIRIEEATTKTPDFRIRSLIRQADQQARALRELVEKKIAEVGW